MINPQGSDEAEYAVPGARLSPLLAYTLRQASTVSGLGRTMLYELLRDGRLQRVKVGARTLIRHDDLAAFFGGSPGPEGHQSCLGV